MKETTTEKKDSGGAYKALVRICGLIGITAFFLPFFNGHSGIELVQDLVKGGKSPLDLIHSITQDREHGSAPTSTVTLMGKIIGVLFLFSIVAFTVISLWMIVSGKYWGGALTILILFNLATWILVQFLGKRAGLMETSFYMDNAGPGYLVSNAALFVPFVGMFFLDKSVR